LEPLAARRFREPAAKCGGAYPAAGDVMRNAKFMNVTSADAPASAEVIYQGEALDYRDDVLDSFNALGFRSKPMAR
jgi:hypothetical protein